MGLSAVFLTQFSDAVNNAEVAKSVPHVVTPNEYTSLSLLNDVFFHLCSLCRPLCTSILRLQLMYVWPISELTVRRGRGGCRGQCSRITHVTEITEESHCLTQKQPRGTGHLHLSFSFLWLLFSLSWYFLVRKQCLSSNCCRCVWEFSKVYLLEMVIESGQVFACCGPPYLHSCVWWGISLLWLLGICSRTEKVTGTQRAVSIIGKAFQSSIFTLSRLWDTFELWTFSCSAADLEWSPANKGGEPVKLERGALPCEHPWPQSTNQAGERSLSCEHLMAAKQYLSFCPKCWKDGAASFHFRLSN